MIENIRNWFVLRKYAWNRVTHCPYSDSMMGFPKKTQKRFAKFDAQQERDKKNAEPFGCDFPFWTIQGVQQFTPRVDWKIHAKGRNATNGAWTVNQPLFLLRNWTVEIESWWYFKQNLVSNDWWELPSPSNKKVAQVAQCSHSWNGNAALVSTFFETAPHKGAKGQFEWCRPNIHWCLRDWFHVENLLRSKIVRGKGRRVGKTKTSMVWAWNVDVDSQVPKKTIFFLVNILSVKNAGWEKL